MVCNFTFVLLILSAILIACGGATPTSSIPPTHEVTASLPSGDGTSSVTPSFRPTPEPTEDVTYARRTPFVPLDSPLLLGSDEADYLPDEELVLGLHWSGHARAYPIRMMTYHHIVNDVVGGRPLLITY